MSLCDGWSKTPRSSLTSVAPLRTEPHSFAAVGPCVQFEAAMPPSLVTSLGKPILGKPMSHRLWGMILKLQLPRGVGLAAALLVMCGGLIYGVIKATMFRRSSSCWTKPAMRLQCGRFSHCVDRRFGQPHLKREEVIGLTAGKPRCFFLTLRRMRKRLESDPWWPKPRLSSTRGTPDRYQGARAVRAMAKPGKHCRHRRRRHPS